MRNSSVGEDRSRGERVGGRRPEQPEQGEAAPGSVIARFGPISGGAGPGGCASSSRSARVEPTADVVRLVRRLMAMELALWRLTDKPVRLAAAAMPLEARLEESGRGATL
jgi:hypothetical protein